MQVTSLNMKKTRLILRLNNDYDSTLLLLLLLLLVLMVVILEVLFSLYKMRLVDTQGHQVLYNSYLPVCVCCIQYLRNETCYNWFCEDTCLFIIMDYYDPEN
jgi:hypothetical protein